MKQAWQLGAALTLSLAMLVGCGSEDGDGDDGGGTVTVSIWGEEYIEDGIPADVFEDGWSVKFDQFLVVISDIHANDSSNEGSRYGFTHLVDLVTPGPYQIYSFDLAARAWPEFGYTIAPAATDYVLYETASDEQLERMLDSGYSVYVSGSASRQGVIKTFAWGFTNSTRYDECVSEIDGKETPGIVVANGADEIVQVTIHGDHFFYDDLASQSAVPRFDAMAAADGDDDGEVTLDELSAVKLVDIPQGTYGTGSASHVDDLGAFVRALTTTIGHFRGEGHCVTIIL